MPDAWFQTPQTDIAELDRDAPEQRRVDAETTSMALYHYETCMFCARVRSVIERLELHIELRNIHIDREHLRDLVNGGGRMTVPCLRIDGDAVTWMYESADIIRFLVARFGARSPS